MRSLLSLVLTVGLTALLNTPNLACAATSSPTLVPTPAPVDDSKSVDYDCGGGFEDPCDPDIFRKCVADCIAGTYPVPSKAPKLLISNYSEECSTCMGTLGYCGAKNCTLECIQGSFENSACRSCNVKNCNNQFMTCSGLNVALPEEATINFVPILIGALAGGFVVLVLAVLIGYVHRQRTKQLKMLSPDEMAQIALSQSYSVQSPIVSGSLQPLSSSFKVDSGSLGSHVSNPIYQKGSPSASPTSSFNSGSNLTPYQQQYMAQQEALAKGTLDGRQSRMAPSQRVSQMAAAMIAAPPRNVAASATRLVVIYDFVGERDDELTAPVGTRMFGIEQQDGWWLAQTDRGVVGLIPVSYTEVDDSPIPEEADDPNF